ncbi:Fic family protein [Candidatus Uhrbacteria bacterium]|nr:Fic family protein [Candidatus Uhrbacteria bacterium]
MEEPRRDRSEPPPIPPEARELREHERDEKGFLLDTVRELGLSPQPALEVLARYDTRAMNDELRESTASLTERYGIKFTEFSTKEQKQIMVLYHSVEETKSAETTNEFADKLTRLMHDGLTRRALRRLDALKNELMGAKQEEEARDALRGLLDSMAVLARQIPPDKKENEPYWQGLLARFQQVATSRREMGAHIQRVYDELFEEFQPLIEDELVQVEIERRMKAGRPQSAEAVMQEIYGRTRDEIEVVKRRNREDVVLEIMKMKEEPYVTIEQLARLHEVNNRDVVPRKESRLRGGEEVIYFGMRMGTLPEDVRTEVEQVVGRVNALVDEQAVSGVSQFRYEMAAAQAHNDLLDIHPFPDRNGSTSLLFLELLAARRGYEPAKERESNYYRQLRQALGNNPIAIGIVGYEQYRIRYRPGYYEGITTGEKGRKELYAYGVERARTLTREILERHRREKAERRKAKKRKEKPN